MHTSRGRLSRAFVLLAVLTVPLLVPTPAAAG